MSISEKQRVIFRVIVILAALVCLFALIAVLRLKKSQNDVSLNLSRHPAVLDLLVTANDCEMLISNTGIPLILDEKNISLGINPENTVMTAELKIMAPKLSGTLKAEGQKVEGKWQYTLFLFTPSNPGMKPLDILPTLPR